MPEAGFLNIKWTLCAKDAEALRKVPGFSERVQETAYEVISESLFLETGAELPCMQEEQLQA